MGEAIDYALPGRRRRRRGWAIWVLGIVMGAGLIWFGPGAWRDGVRWGAWKVAPWVQAGEERVVWEEGGRVVYENWAWTKWSAHGPPTWRMILTRNGQEEGDAIVDDITIGSRDYRIEVSVRMTDEAGGAVVGSVWLFDGKTRWEIRVEPDYFWRHAHESGLGPRRERVSTRPSDRIEGDGVPMNGKVWAGRVDPGDRNRFLVDYEWYGKRETFEVRVTVDAKGNPLVVTRWLGGK